MQNFGDLQIDVDLHIHLACPQVFFCWLIFSFQFLCWFQSWLVFIINCSRKWDRPAFSLVWCAWSFLSSQQGFFGGAWSFKKRTVLNCVVTSSSVLQISARKFYSDLCWQIVSYELTAIAIFYSFKTWCFPPTWLGSASLGIDLNYAKSKVHCKKSPNNISSCSWEPDATHLIDENWELHFAAAPWQYTRF